MMNCQNCGKPMSRTGHKMLMNTLNKLVFFACPDGHKDHEIVPMSPAEIKGIEPKEELKT